MKNAMEQPILSGLVVTWNKVASNTHMNELTPRCGSWGSNFNYDNGKGFEGEFWGHGKILQGGQPINHATQHITVPARLHLIFC